MILLWRGWAAYFSVGQAFFIMWLVLVACNLLKYLLFMCMLGGSVL